MLQLRSLLSSIEIEIVCFSPDYLSEWGSTREDLPELSPVKLTSRLQLTRLIFNIENFVLCHIIKVFETHLLLVLVQELMWQFKSLNAEVKPG